MAAALLGLDYNFHKFSGNFEYVRAQNQFYAAGNPSIKPLVGNLHKAKLTSARIFNVNFLKGKMKTIEFNTAFDWESITSEESGFDLDYSGDDKIVISAATQEEGDSIQSFLKIYGNCNPVPTKPPPYRWLRRAGVYRPLLWLKSGLFLHQKRLLSPHQC